MKFQGPEGLSGVLCKFGSILHPSQELQPNGAHSYILCVCVLACVRERERGGVGRGNWEVKVYVFVRWGKQDHLRHLQMRIKPFLDSKESRCFLLV